MGDDVTITTMFFSDVLDGTVTWEDEPEMTFDVSLTPPDDTITWEDDVTMVVTFDMDTDDTVTWSDTNSATISAFAIIIGDTIGWQDGAGYGFDPSDVPIIIINEGDIIDNSGGTIGSPAPTIPDSDGDGFLDNVDFCLNVFGVAPNGCPLVVPPVVVVPPSVDLPFELSQLDVIDDNIVLDTESAQAQVEDLTIRWTGSQPITITNVEVGDSPFDIQIEDIPVQIGTSEYGISEYDILYSVQEPFSICTNDFSFDCLAPVTYDIPVVVTGEIDGRIVITEGRLE